MRNLIATTLISGTLCITGCATVFPDGYKEMLSTNPTSDAQCVHQLNIIRTAANKAEAYELGQADKMDEWGDQSISSLTNPYTSAKSSLSNYRASRSLATTHAFAGLIYRGKYEQAVDDYDSLSKWCTDNMSGKYPAYYLADPKHPDKPEYPDAAWL